MKHIAPTRAANLLSLLILAACSPTPAPVPPGQEPVVVMFDGAHHLGEDHIIIQYFVGKYGGSRILEIGYGGDTHCCVTLPKQWRPGLKIDVRWEVVFPREPGAHTVHASDLRPTRIYRAQVPIERYQDPRQFYVHFFPNGKVRILTSTSRIESPKHPIPLGFVKDDALATQGRQIKLIFTDTEREEFEKEKMLREGWTE